MCTEERKRLEGHREEEQRSETKKAVVTTSTEDYTDTTPLIQTVLRHREQDRDKYKVLACKLEQTTGPTDDSQTSGRSCFPSDLSNKTGSLHLQLSKQWCRLHNQ